MCIRKFKITNLIKRELARKVKNEIGNKDYVEFLIMYNENSESFYIAETIEREKLESEGECYYKLFSHTKADGMLTLIEIEQLIFN